MLKLFCVSPVIVALLLLMHLQQSTEAFKIIKVLNKQGGGGSSSLTASSAVAAPALDAGTLLKGVTSAVSTKLNLITSLASSVLQLKRNLKQNLLTSFRSKFNHPNSITTAHAKPFFTKNFNFGAVGGGAAAASPTDSHRPDGYTY